LKDAWTSANRHSPSTSVYRSSYSPRDPLGVALGRRGGLEVPLAARRIAVVLQTGGDRTFSAGHDVAQFDAADFPDPDRTREIHLDLLDSIDTFPLSLIAAVDGPAVGAGANVASLCDDRILAPDAHVAITEINVGIIGGLGPLRRVLPDGVARRLADTGEELSGERAAELGFARCD
jgi:enoyl-CoA hydratase